MSSFIVLSEGAGVGILRLPVDYNVVWECLSAGVGTCEYLQG